MDELLPCPFCGSENVKWFPPEAEEPLWVGCNNCFAIGPYNAEWIRAIATWNKRAKPPTPGERSPRIHDT